MATVFPCIGMPKYTFAATKRHTIVKQHYATQCFGLLQTFAELAFSEVNSASRLQTPSLLWARIACLIVRMVYNCTVEDQHTTQEQCYTLIYCNEIHICQALTLSKGNSVPHAKKKKYMDHSIQEAKLFMTEASSGHFYLFSYSILKSIYLLYFCYNSGTVFTLRSSSSNPTTWTSSIPKQATM